MTSVIRHEFLNGWESSEDARRGGNGRLEVNVLFTDPKWTRAALRTAGALARDLNATVRVLAMQAVPFALPLTQPPVPIPVMEKLLLRIAEQEDQGPIEINLHLYLCRDRLDTLAKVLERNSLVVIGGRRGWLSDASCMARKLRSRGHQVIVVGNRKVATGGNRRFDATPVPENVRKHA